MQKTIYVSGFLYHGKSGQILLQQSASNSTLPLTLFGEKIQKGEDPRKAFQRTILRTLGISLPTNYILPVYDYVHATLGNQYIFYVDIKDSAKALKYQGKQSSWFPLSKLSKLNLSTQTRHDLIIGERVIKATEASKQE